MDMRDQSDDDDMQNWDDAKLQEVIDKKHGDEKRRPTTDIVSNFKLISYISYVLFSIN